MGELARYPLLSAEQELEAAREVRRAELAFWLEVLEYGPAFQLIATLDARARSSSRRDLRCPALRKLWRACEARSSRHCGAESTSRTHSKELAAAIHGWDVSRHGMQLALAWVEDRARDTDSGSRVSAGSFVAYRRTVRRVHRAQARAKQRFASANLRLVVKIAGQHNHGGLALSDLIQEGNIGLMTAVERFDASRGLRFSTYASFWIRHAIRRALTDKSRTVRAPGHRQRQTRELARATGRWLARTGTAPTTGELAQELGWPECRVRDLQQLPSITVWSLQRPMAEQHADNVFLDSLADSRAIAVDEALASRARSTELVSLLSELKPVEAYILRCRFGLNGAGEATFRSLGDELELSRERVRQLQRSALQQLRRRLETAPGESSRAAVGPGQGRPRSPGATTNWDIAG